MEDLFMGARDLLESAQGHLKELISILEAVFNDDWADIVHEPDSQSRDVLCKVRFSQPIPIRSATRVFNVVTEQRAALDHAVYAATVALTGNVDPSSTKFPFGDTVAEFELNMRERAKHVPPDIRAALAGLKPYKAGNRALWRLNKIRNVKDHRKLIVPAPRARLADASATGRMSHLVTIYNTAGPDNDYVIARIHPGADTELKIRLFFHVAFDEVAAVKGLDPVGFLVQTQGAVGHAVSEIERATIWALKRRADPNAAF